MDIKDFVRETLVQIAEGIQEANNKFDVDDEDGIAAAAMPHSINRRKVAVGDQKHQYLSEPQKIDFDVAVMASSESSAEGSAGIVIPFLEFGGKGERSFSNESVSRVRFSIVMQLPTSKQKYEEVAFVS